MSKFSLYNIDLKNVKDGVQSYDFTLNDEYFKKIDSPEVQRGNINANIKVKKLAEGAFQLAFNLQGAAIVQCNRCLDDMEQSIDCRETLKVKFSTGNSYEEDGDTVVVPEREGAINVAWFMYEFVTLNVPIKHVHPSGECNKTMMTKLRKHIAHSADENENEADAEEIYEEEENYQSEQETDPRWDSLKELF